MDILSKYQEPPQESLEIIQHHHGSLNGQGFSESGTAKLSKNSQVFIIANEFVTELLKYRKSKSRPKPILETLYEKYPNPKMISVLKALEKTLKKGKTHGP